MFISPMLLHNAKDNLPFNDDNYISTIKWDGIRLIVSKINGKVNLYTRHNNNITMKFPELLSPGIPDNTIIDCELIVADSEGKSDFEAVMQRFQSKKSKHKVTVIVFDLIMCKGLDVTSLPLLQRLEMLSQTLVEEQYYKLADYVDGTVSVEYFNICKTNGLEGTIIKAKDSKYQVGKRSYFWQKVIAYETSEVVITGFNKKKFGWLIGRFEGDKVKPLGTMELGVGAKERKAAWPVLNKLVIDERKDFAFVQPVIKCKVKHRGWYKSGMMRLPVFEQFVF